MKLLSLTNWYYMGFTILIFVIGSLISFQLFRNKIDRQFNEKLNQEKEQFIQELNNYNELKESYFLNIGDRIEIIEIDSIEVTSERISDTIIYDNFDRRFVNFRRLSFCTLVDGQYYSIVISKSLVTNEELVEGIGEIMLILFLGLGISLVIMNAILSKRIWVPFHEIIDHIKSFDVTQPGKNLKVSTNIDEFKKLAASVILMLSKFRKDYRNLKEFTENSSHEIQTPLSIIKTETEFLLQLRELSDKDLGKVKSINEAAGRLSRINQSLVLLTKIENKQIVDNQNIDLVSLIKDLLDKMSELMSLKNIKSNLYVDGNPILAMNKELADVLFTNLLINAITHNLNGGTIRITITSYYFNISNTGAPLTKPPETMFERFKKDKTSNSPGLGLSLVKEICDLYNLIISYRYRSKLHTISIQF